MENEKIKVSRLLSIFTGLTHALGKSDNVDEGIHHCLQSICSGLGWNFSAFWIPDSSVHALELKVTWYASGSYPSDFLREKKHMHFKRGEGLPGQAWEQDSVLWLENLEEYENFPRKERMLERGVRAGVAIPIRSFDTFYGVMEFLSEKQEPYDPDLAAGLEAIGAQVGQLMRRSLLIQELRLAKLDLENSERIIKNSEEKFRAVFFQAPLAMSLNTISGQWLMVNDSYCKTFGYDQEELMAMPLSVGNLTHPDDRHLDEDILRKFAKNEVTHMTVEKRYIKKNGEVLCGILSINSFEDPLSSTRYLLAAILDITSLKQAESKIKYNLEQQAFLAKASYILGNSLDPGLNLQKLADLTAGELCDWCFVDVLTENNQLQRAAVSHPNPQLQKLLVSMGQKFPPSMQTPVLAEVIKTGRGKLIEEVSLEMIEGMGREAEYLSMLRHLGIHSAIVTPLKARGKTLGGMTLISARRDRTFTESELALALELGGRAGMAIDNSRLYHQAQLAIRSRDSFLSIASHELRTPISSIMLLLEFMQQIFQGQRADHRPVDPQLENAVSMSVGQLNRLVDLLEDLLDVSRIQVGKLSFRPEEFDLADCISQVAGQYQEQLALAGCRASFELDQSIKVHWDRMRFEQVLVNLLTNAIKYAPGAELVIRTRAIDAHSVRLEFIDHGPGVPGQKLDTIFNRFERATSSRSISGLGLGLYIVKAIIESHQGSIRASSSEGKGLKFVIEVPVRPRLEGLDRTERN